MPGSADAGLQEAPHGSNQPRIPTTGQRNTQKIFGAVALQHPQSHFRQDIVFNGETYLQFLQQLADCYPRRRVILIHDNVAYHRAPEVKSWLHGHRRFEVTPRHGTGSRAMCHSKSAHNCRRIRRLRACVMAWVNCRKPSSQVVQAVEEVRRRESKQDAVAREQLEKTCWLWRKNPEAWTERDAGRWEQLHDKPLVTGLAYAMRLQLQRAYRSGTATQARQRFKDWCQWVRMEAQALTSGLLEPMRQAAEIVTRHLEGFLGHWKAGLTTAFLEGLNSLFSATKRKARGYRSSEYQIAMLDFVAGKLELPHY